MGYYQEDPATNPEDPVPGAFALHLPATDTAFSGSMYFTYVGCQSSNVGTVSGTKTGATLAGQWSGMVDGVAQSGAYAGTYDTATQAYAGTYTNAKGKQFRNLEPCISYHIAPKGSWEMFAVGARAPASFEISVSGRKVAWSAVPAAATTLVYVLDATVAPGSGNPVMWQTVVDAGTSITIPSSVVLQPGKSYVVAVRVGNSSAGRVAFGSQPLTRP